MSGNSGRPGNSGATIADDMTALDQLPPATRDAIYYSVMPWSAAKILARMRAVYPAADQSDAEDMRDEILRIDAAAVASTSAVPPHTLLQFPPPALKVRPNVRYIAHERAERRARNILRRAADRQALYTR